MPLELTIFDDNMPMNGGEDIVGTAL